jgi:branched-chain amino acid transport system permease protein
LQMILQILISGIAMGFIYSLVGYEFTLIWNAASLINFAHDRFIMFAAYIFAGTFVIGLGLNPIVAALITIIIMGVFGALVAIGIFNPLRNMPSDIFAVTGTLLLARILGELSRIIWGPVPFTIHNFLTGVVRFGGISLPQSNIVIIGVSLAFLIFLQLLFKKTRIGKAMRCVSQDKTASSLMGINVPLYITFTIALSSMICTVIGILIIPTFMVSNSMASMIGLKGFAASVVGGFGILPGNIVGGLTIGILENLAVVVLPAVYKDVVAFALLILFLLVRPNGILGKQRN